MGTLVVLTLVPLLGSFITEPAAMTLAALLLRMDQHPYGRDYVGSMSIAGQRGTLRHQFNGTSLEGRVFGKTGTLSGVKALAGYVPVEGDSPVRFVMLLNKDGIDNKTAYRPIWALLGNGLGRASAGPRVDDLAP